MACRGNRSLGWCETSHGVAMGITDRQTSTTAHSGDLAKAGKGMDQGLRRNRPEKADGNED